MKVLLSIRPEYAEKIFAGEKQFEFRRTLFRRHDVSTVVVYATLPVGKILGEFDISDIIEDEPEKIWEATKKAAGITRGRFLNYFSGKQKGYAIKVGDVRKYHVSIDPYDFDCDFIAPQSFRYIDDNSTTSNRQRCLALA